MKKVISLIVLAGLMPFIYQKILQSNSAIQIKENFVSDFEEIQLSSIEHEGIGYRYDFFSIDSSKNISFNTNLENKKTSIDILENENCQFLINGGFYDKQDSHIGLVIDQNEIISKNQVNALFNGYVVATSSALYISDSEAMESDDIEFVFQTGPLLIKDEAQLELQIKNDEMKRRMIVAQDLQGAMHFMIIINKESLYEGPLLEKLPAVLQAIFHKENLQIKNAINLDGGSASTFYAQGTHIKELRTIGSYVCVK